MQGWIDLFNAHPFACTVIVVGVLGVGAAILLIKREGQ